MNLWALDCSRFDPAPDAETVEWLAALARDLRTSEHVLALGSARDDDEPILFCDVDGSWRTGRYIGSLSFNGRTLTILPRLGLPTIRKWLARANNLLLLETPGELRPDESFIAELLARVWGHGLAEAARHGLPALRADVVSRGSIVRGRLDVAASVASRSLLHQRVVSTRRQRTLENPIARTIACAFAVLRRWMGAGTERSWLPVRCQELLPQLLAVTGTNPELPSEAELSRVRYTPITQSYRRFVRFSWQLARQRGLFGDAALAGKTIGVLLDVAELWELYVVSIAREAALPLVVKHGTHEHPGRDHLLQSTVDRSVLGQLRPDVLVERNRRPFAVLDAKYKCLAAGPRPEDLYQLSAYLLRFGAKSPIRGALLYPLEEDGTSVLTHYEVKSPWHLQGESTVSLLTLPHDPTRAVEKLRQFLSDAAIRRG